jgi:hypothetical protein
MAIQLTLKQVRDELRRHGVNAKGPKSELIERLQLCRAETSEPPTTETSNPRQSKDDVCDAIVSCTVEPGADDTMVVHAKRGLNAVVDSDDLRVESF